MAYDEGLAERIRGALDERLDVAEKRMFGGIAFMVRGHMCVGIVKDELMKAAVVTACLCSSALVAGAEEAGPRHLIYLHGRIIQERQDARPRHPEFGYYELEQILATFRERGFVVTGEIRPKDAPLMVSADRVVEQIRGLLASGVPASRITVVGGSMGAAIALRASLRLQNPALRYGVLGACMSQSVPLLLAEYGAKPAGRILAIREKSDETSEPCPAWSGDTGPKQHLVVREILLDTGLRHGFLYRPLREWVEPVVDWALAALDARAARVLSTRPDGTDVSGLGGLPAVVWTDGQP